MNTRLNVLIIEDMEDDAVLLVRELRRGGYDVTYKRVDTASDLSIALDHLKWDVILSDYSMPSFNASAALKLVQERGIDIPFIIVSGTIGEETAVAALKAGAHDFIVKSHLARLIPAIERERREAEERDRRSWIEKELHQSEERFIKAFHASPIGISITSQTRSVFLDVNEQFLNFVGYDREEVIGYASVELGIWTNLQERATVDQALRERGAVRNVEIKFRTKSGELRDGLASFAMIDLGDEPCVLSLFHDITEHKQAEVAVRQREADFRNLFANNPRPMWLYDLETINFLDVNEAAITHYGYSREEFLQMRITDIRPKEDLPRLVEDLKQSSPGLRRSGEWQHLKKNGQIIDVEIVSHTLEFMGYDAVLVVAHDITERKQAEDELKELYNATSYLFKADSLLNLGHQIVEAVVHEFKKVDCGLILVDRLRNKMIPLARSGVYDVDIDRPIAFDGPGLVMEAIRTGQIVSAPDVTAHAQYVMNDPRTQSELVILLRTTKGILGVLDLQSTELNAFKQPDQRILAAFGERAAAAIEIMQLYEEINHRAAELEQRVLDRTAELEWAKRRVEVILNNSPDGILLAYTDLRIQQTNTAFDRLLACETDDYFNQSLLNLIRAEDSERVAASIQEVLSERTDKHIETQVRRKDGTLFHTEFRMGYIHDLNEEWDGLVCTIRDISKRKQAEQALQAKMDEEREFQGYLKALHEITIALTQMDSLDEFYKRAVALGLQRLGFERMALFLYDPAQNLAYGTYGTDPQGQLVNEATSQFTLMPNSIMMRAFRQAERLCIDEPIELYDGDRQLVGMGWNAAAVLWNGTESLGWLVADNLLSQKPATKPLMEILSLYSLTLGTLLAHKQAAAALKNSEGRLRESEWMLQNVLETIPVRVFWKDQHLSFLGANRLYLQDVGLISIEEIVGKNELKMPWSKRGSDYIDEDQVVLSSGIPLINHEMSVTLEDGQTQWFQTSKVPLRDIRGAIIGILAAYTDITERKQMEEELRQALEKERDLNELKSRFVSMVSHEFRTPLTVILSGTEILATHYDRLDPEKRVRHFDKIRNQVGRMVALLNDVLTISRDEAGATPFNPMPISLHRFCQGIAEEFQSNPNMKHTLSYSHSDGPTRVLVDEKLLQHAVINLLTNAFKYSPEGSTVDFKLSFDQENAIIRIQDSGMGIPEADLPRLFEAFHRAGNVGTVEGTGLGLAIVKRSIDAQGGTITVESQIGIGTTFMIRLPLIPYTTEGSIEVESTSG